MRNICLYLLVVFMIGCTENESLIAEESTAQIIDKGQVLNASLKQQIEYKRHHMGVISKWIANHGIDLIQSETKSEENLLRSSSNLKSSTDLNASYEVLVSELVESSAYDDNNIILDSNSIDHSLDKLRESLNAFTDLGEDSWYPSLRVLESNLENPNKSTKTILSVEDADENGEKFTHYFIEKDGSLQNVDFAVSPESTQKYNFIVLEIVKRSESEVEEESTELSGKIVSFNNPYS